MWRAGKVTADGSGVSLSPLAYVAAYDHQGDLSAAGRAMYVPTPLPPIVGGARTDATPGPDCEPDRDPSDELLAMLLDWPTFWAVDRQEAEWLAEPILAAKRSHAIYAPGGEGKSLLALWLAAAIATGRPIFGHTNPPIDVLYLDYEMTADDLAERLENMDYGPDTDLATLHYALLPSLPGLDQPDGGKAVVTLARLVRAELVIIDTFGRAVHGDENEADTVRNWYRWTGLHLKAEHRSFVRIDHAGKDLDRGQRGSSAKNDDVDVVWQLARRDADTFRLTAKKRRMSWIPETVDLHRRDDPTLEYALLSDGTSYPAGTAKVAADLDELGVPVDITKRQAIEALKAAGKGARARIVLAALRYRRESYNRSELGVLSGSQISGTTPPAVPAGTTREPPPPETANNQVNGSGTTTGTTGNHSPSTDGNQGGLPVGEPPGPGTTPEPPRERLL